MAKKSTKAEVDYRVNRVARLLSNGAVRSEVCQYAASEWGCSVRQADRYIAEARELLKADWDIDRRTFTAELLSQLASLQKEARKNGNQAHVALGCINAMARIAHILE
jgi:hypothetical protein